MMIYLNLKKILLKTSKTIFSGIFNLFSKINKGFYNKFLLPIFYYLFIIFIEDFLKIL